ncbi:MAG: cysteine desulfurase [Clostridia bacterium]|nr:cysteine desulfurase [Clostridia bacterium]MBQ8469890.1 cysteine desulfurase [Clostridia bacterium]MBR1703843.1 cysteine desulfurase [Clostridia bacterium]
MECYFDNSATTSPLPEAVDAVTKALTENWGNPSSLHKVGDAANELLEASRRTLAGAFSCKPAEVYFTAGGTESNNIAVFGTVEALKRRGNRIITTAVEHPSVEEPMKRLEAEGFDVVRLPVDGAGRVSEEAIFGAVNDKTILVSLMLVNNEVGSIMPVEAAAKALKRAKAPGYVHVDAVQGFGKVPVGPKALGADLISVSSHKVHGPKGVGALYVKKGTRLVSPVLGGGQEEGIRSGTQGMPAIAGFAAAVEKGILDRDLSQSIAHVTALRDTVKEAALSVDFGAINSGDDALPYILNLSLEGIPSEVLRNYLSDRGVYVSTGSACSKGHRSTVLTQMGLEARRIDSAVRFSFSHTNTLEEAAYAAAALKEAAGTLRRG